MKKIKLTKEEQAIEDSLEEFVPVSDKEYEEIARAIAAYRKDAVLNIRINKYDLTHLKQKAQKLGIRYQTFIAEILHRVAQA
jgi:predicted DNA binding CopG/RHH family protein